MTVPRLRPISVKAWLALAVGIALIPALIFSVYLLSRNNSDQQEVVATLAASTVAANTDAINRQLGGMVTTIRALSLSDALRREDLAAFQDEANRALAGTGTYAIVVDRDMNQLLNTRRPFGSALAPTNEPEPLREAIRTRRPVISDGFRGGVAQKWIFYVVIALETPTGRLAALAISQDSEALGQSLRMENLRGGWNAAIVDNQGVTLATTFMSSDIGKPFFLAQALGADDRPQQSVGYDGREYRVLTERSDLTGWRVHLWADSANVVGSILRTYRVLAVGGAALLALGLGAAWLIGRQLSRSVRGLAEDAARLGLGQNVTARRFPVDELNTVSNALAAAAEDRRKAENEIRFLMREVAHRSKNQLTVVSSLAKQSAAGAASVDDFSETFGHRIMGLARSTDLLIAGSVAGVDIGELIHVQVEPFKPSDESDMQISGPPFRVSSQAAQTLGLALHELATNAAKHGALSKPGGVLTATWTIGNDKLEIRWRETVLGEIEAATRKGFGTRLIARTLGALGAEIESTYHSDGLEYIFTFPVARLLEGAAPAGATA